MNNNDYKQPYQAEEREPVAYYREAPVQRQEPQITSLSRLRSYSTGAVVELPPFSEGQPLVARVKRPSLLSLAKSGEIPNSLLTTANELFASGGRGIDRNNGDMLKDMYGVMEAIAKASLVEPSFDDIKEAGLELTDEQMMAIFSYSQEGVKALESFRK